MKNSKLKNKDENVYLSHIEQDGWNDMHLYYVEGQAVWRNLAILAIMALTIVSIYAIYIVNQDKHKTLIFEKDSLGNVIALGIATKTLNVDNKMISHQLVNFITSLREVPEDINLKRRNIDIVHKMVDQKLKKQVDQIIIDQYNKGKVVLVSVKSIRPMPGGSSWEIAWNEKYFDSNEVNVESEATFSSIVTFKRLENIKPEIQLVNPIGLFITYLHPVKDIGG